MALLFYSLNDDPQAWREALCARIPDLDFRIWPDLGDPEEIEMALVWRPPPGLLASLPDLRAIFSLGAGIDALLADPTLPDVPLCRMVDPSLTRSMSEYALALVLFYHRRLDLYAEQQRRALWRMEMPRPASDTTVGVMGLGELGSDAARSLAAHGFRVRGWSRTRRELAGVESFAGETELGSFLAGLDIVICLLPLTPATEGILNADLFARLPRGACLVHLARGAHLVEQDLLDAVERGHLRGAVLDVFREEPLPPEHPFWRHPRIRVTPHSASYSLPETGAEVVADNIRRLRAGRPLRHVVRRERGY